MLATGIERREHLIAKENPTQKHVCGRCMDDVDVVYAANCSEKPELLAGQPIGQYHCADCGAMVLAGLPHPPMCKVCIDRKHPAFDDCR